MPADDLEWDDCLASRRREVTVQRTRFTLIHQEKLAPKTYRMVLSGDTSAITAPGQFVNIALEGKFLRRPISVCDWKEGELTILYKVVGQGTEQMSRMVPGIVLDILTGLGNGYDLAKSGDKPLLIGGGAGIPPMYALAKALLAQGKHPQVILGFNQASEQFFLREFKDLGVDVTVTTVDGSLGVKGFVTDAMTGEYTYVYTCGPLPMLKAIDGKALTSGQFSFEERMGCGFGACMGCTCQTKYGNKRICREGPVLEREEIIW
ncbi:MAG: dihydroorotate dehydrogenase electron transfer subunit [Firmicutes bacterium]|nr:dihydroorotate dehydrogenase electron transfer subunit [Bacillota bacterium]